MKVKTIVVKSKNRRREKRVNQVIIIQVVIMRTKESLLHIVIIVEKIQ